jgi:hypothetical protein
LRNPLDRWKQRQARRRYMPRADRQRTGTLAKVSIFALVLIIAAGAVLELRRGGSGEAELVGHAQNSRMDGLDLIETAGQSRRLIFLADIPSAAAPKQFAARAVERLAAGPGLDLVVLDIDAAEQPFIDLYLATAPEDASILMARPRAIREGDGASRDLLDLYRTVWRVNQELGAYRRIRIVAADRAGWPPDRSVSPQAAATLFGERDAHMMETVMQRSLQREPNARVLFFMNGLHVLKSGGGRIQTGGASPVDVQWLASRMREQFPQDVYSILTDAPSARAVGANVATYRGTQLGEVLRRGDITAGSGFRLGGPFDELTRTPIRVVGTTGLDFALEPRTAPLSELADAYIYFGN